MIKNTMNVIMAKVIFPFKKYSDINAYTSDPANGMIGKFITNHTPPIQFNIVFLLIKSYQPPRLYHMLHQRIRIPHLIIIPSQNFY